MASGISRSWSRCRARTARKLWPTPRPILQTTKVRFVGDPVALVVAETRQGAQDAAELIEVEYDLLPPRGGHRRSRDRDGAPPVWEERGSNLCVHWSSGREAEADAASSGPPGPCRWSW